MGVEGLCAVVTGGCGFVGLRLCEMLIERGARRVRAFDVVPPPPWAPQRKELEFITGDIRSAQDVDSAVAGTDVVFHLAALVGVFHPKELYEQVNHRGTLHVIAACRRHGVRRIVFSGTPSTRMDGRDIRGAEIDELPRPRRFLAEYARTKARGEDALIAAVNGSDGGEKLLAITVAPHQVYGPHDTLFLPQLMYASKLGKLRVFGGGANCISLCFIDNYCHALILAYDRLYETSSALGEFYLVTDGGCRRLWDILEEASVYLGYGSVKRRGRIPRWLMMAVAATVELCGRLLGRTTRINRFTARMLMIDRWFGIAKAERELAYRPLYTWDQGWQMTLKWFAVHKDFLEERARAALRKRPDPRRRRKA